jgi:hypothetical protein
MRSPPAVLVLCSPARPQVNYTCIPQKHKALQITATHSLWLYAALANALVIAAPETMHASTSMPVGPESNQRRAWCRAEQVSACARCSEPGYLLKPGVDLPISAAIGPPRSPGCAHRCLAHAPLHPCALLAALHLSSATSQGTAARTCGLQSLRTLRQSPCRASSSRRA